MDHHLPASETHDGPTLNAGSVALLFFMGSEPELFRNPKFCDFSGGGGVSGPPVPLEPHMFSLFENIQFH